MNVLMIGKGVATVLGFVLLSLGGSVAGTPFEAWGPAMQEIGQYIGGFGLLRKGVVDWNWFGKVR